VLDSNEIESCELVGHMSIEFLSLNKNKLSSLAGLDELPLLQVLSVTETETLSSFKGISNCPNLSKLVLSQNSKLEGIDEVPDLPGLEELHLNGCPIAKLEDVEKLKTLRRLKVLNLAETPLAEEKGDDLKKEILILLDMLHLTKINGDDVTKEDRTEAANEKKERIKAAEEAKR
jgi:Leucine-rich repeat (LRR) protein